MGPRSVTTELETRVIIAARKSAMSAVMGMLPIVVMDSLRVILNSVTREKPTTPTRIVCRMFAMPTAMAWHRTVVMASNNRTNIVTWVMPMRMAMDLGLGSAIAHAQSIGRIVVMESGRMRRHVMTAIPWWMIVATER